MNNEYLLKFEQIILILFISWNTFPIFFREKFRLFGIMESLLFKLTVLSVALCTFAQANTFKLFSCPFLLALWSLNVSHVQLLW